MWVLLGGRLTFRLGIFLACEVAYTMFVQGNKNHNTDMYLGTTTLQSPAITWARFVLGRYTLNSQQLWVEVVG